MLAAVLLWAIGGYYAADYVVGTGYRWLYWIGLILLTALPSTVQASIAFTSVAGGNVPAALCSASASNLLGVFLTPLIAGFLQPVAAPAQAPTPPTVPKRRRN